MSCAEGRLWVELRSLLRSAWPRGNTCAFPIRLCQATPFASPRPARIRPLCVRARLLPVNSLRELTTARCSAEPAIAASGSGHAREPARPCWRRLVSSQGESFNDTRRGG